ncbi:MAG: hypothetical protein Ct9H90mP19_2330 [Gammaproteobacteria bacterium]|nr:MAG: hypothetical protein Ct9H90mP19_2330 [Gammaproteobacteria bacterium]
MEKSRQIRIERVYEQELQGNMEKNPFKEMLEVIEGL